jgi:hypothetical protein
MVDKSCAIYLGSGSGGAPTKDDSHPGQLFRELWMEELTVSR